MANFMLVDDEAPMVDYIERLIDSSLTLPGEHRCWKFTDGDSATAYIEKIDDDDDVPEEELPDIIITGFYMPGPNGDEFAERVRQSAKVGDIPIILLTAEDFYQDEKDEMHFNDYLPKPVDPAILDSIKNLLGLENEEE